MKARTLLARSLRMLITLFVVATAVFFMVRLSGDPIEIMAGPDADPLFIERMRERWGLDKPMHEQFIAFMGGTLRGEFGFSMANGMPAAELFMERLPATLLLGLVSLMLSIILGLPLGIFAAIHHNSAIDRVVMSTSVMAFSMPNFFLGVLFILFFSLQMRWLPSFGSGTPAHLVMPVLTLGLSSAGAIARFARSCMLDVLNQNYMLAAEARGIRPNARTILHALPNASIPLVTILGMRLGDLIAGAIIVETVFAWPGVGRLLAESVINRDLAVVQVIVLATAATMVVANLTVDLLYGWFDPRIRQA